MAFFDSLIRDLGNRFNVGPNAAELVRELLKLITSDPAGINGLINKFKSAGLADIVASWIGRSENQTLTASQLESALGKDTITRIANKVGLASGTASSALAFLVPKVIDHLTPDGKIPAVLPADVKAFVSATPAGVTTAAESKGGPRWSLLLPLLALIVAAIVGYWYYNGTVSPVATAPQVTAPAVQPKLSVSNVGGKVQYSGVVADETTRGGILEALKRVFGAENIAGEIGLDPKAGPAAWLANLVPALEKLKIPGVEALFDGTSINIGGLIPDAEREALIAQMQSLFGAGFSIGALLERGEEMFKAAADRTLTALAGLKPGFTSQDLVGALNLAIIRFATGSAEIKPENDPLLAKAAEAIKAAPAGTVIEIGGHTDNVGDAASNQALSQARADAVRAALIKLGVDGARLKAQGYGDTRPVASNATTEGRFLNRRIEFTVVQ